MPQDSAPANPQPRASRATNKELAKHLATVFTTLTALHSRSRLKILLDLYAAGDVGLHEQAIQAGLPSVDARTLRLDLKALRDAAFVVAADEPDVAAGKRYIITERGEHWIESTDLDSAPQGYANVLAADLRDKPPTAPQRSSVL